MNEKRIRTLIVVIIAVVGLYLFSCFVIHQDIEYEIEHANYCTTDADCDVLILGGEYIDFGCYHFVNRDLDKNQFYRRMDLYENCCDWLGLIDACVRAPEAQCISGKCTPVVQN